METEEKLVKKKGNHDEMPKFEKFFYQKHTSLPRNSIRVGSTPKKQGNYSERS